MTELNFGGIHIAMKAPSQQLNATVACYRDVVELSPITDRPPATGFALGADLLCTDEVVELRRRVER
jgi:hypothetical protein